MEAFKPILAKVATAASLSRQEASDAFDAMLSGEVTPAQMGAFLMALRVRGETIEEITGAVAAMRAKMLRVEAPQGAIDIVGTGGDGSGSYNVSTLASIIVAACGVPVAKHGNRAASSKSGSSDVLTALGVKIGLSPRQVEACIETANIGFMMAQTHHAAMRHVGAVRSELGARTLFNLLGPLSNPAGVKFQLLGVFSTHWMEPLAEVLRTLGSQRVWVVHGGDGLDEITTTAPTQVVALENGAIRVSKSSRKTSASNAPGLRTSRAAIRTITRRRCGRCSMAPTTPIATSPSSMRRRLLWSPAKRPICKTARNWRRRPSTPARQRRRWRA